MLSRVKMNYTKECKGKLNENIDMAMNQSSPAFKSFLLNNSL